MQRRTVNDLVDRARTLIDRVDPVRALAEVDQGAVLVDTRCSEALRTEGTIPGSVHIPLSVLYWRLDPAFSHHDPRLADPERRVILLCAHGFSSSLAAATLREMGFARATDVIGGFEAWRTAGLPVDPPKREVTLRSPSRPPSGRRPGASRPSAGARQRRRPQ